jgi:5-methylcytosine-specific restriction enzyme subunit McrC
VSPERVVLQEWQTRLVPGGVLSAKDRALARELGDGSAGRLVVEELREGVRLRSTSWIGVVRFERFEVRVEPKLAGDSLRVVQMLEVTRGIESLRRKSGVRNLHAQGADLFDLFAYLLADECERIVKGGLLHAYVEEEDELPAARGRILWDRQALRRPGRVDRLACRFDELRQDVVENRLLAAALGFCSRRVRHEGVARRSRELEALFREVCDPEKFSATDVADIVYDRLNTHYREAHELAKLLLASQGTDDLLATGERRCFAFLLDMNSLFERLMEAVLRFVLGGQGLQVHAQQRNRSILWDVTRDRPYAPVIPDFVIEPRDGVGPRVTVDAKYKAYDDRQLATSDVYQGFLYAFAYASAAGMPRSLVVHPSENPSGSHRRLHVRTGGATPGAFLDVVGVYIPALLEELRARKRGEHARTLATRVLQASA